MREGLVEKKQSNTFSTVKLQDVDENFKSRGVRCNRTTRFGDNSSQRKKDVVTFNLYETSVGVRNCAGMLEK